MPASPDTPTAALHHGPKHRTRRRHLPPATCLLPPVSRRASPFALVPSPLAGHLPPATCRLPPSLDHNTLCTLPTAAGPRRWNATPRNPRHGAIPGPAPLFHAPFITMLSTGFYT